MKEKFTAFMNKGGYTIIVLIIAFIIYIVGVGMADSCYDKVNAPVIINVNEDGSLNIQYVYDDEKDVHVLWETDAGNVKPVADNALFEEQKNIDNPGYFCYTNVADKVVWDKSDADGNNYTIANVRATLYEEIKDTSVYDIRNNFIELYITVTTDENGKTVKTENRFFSNPVREGSDNQWDEIYAIAGLEENKVTYRYRTGKSIDTDKDLYMRWQCTQPVLSETDVIKGYVPEFQISQINKDCKSLTQINTVTVDLEKVTGECGIEAFLVDNNHFSDENVDEKYKINKTVITIKGK